MTSSLPFVLASVLFCLLEVMADLQPYRFEPGCVPSGAPAAQRPSKRSPICSLARTHNDNDRVAQDGDHTANNRLTETCSLGLLCPSLILDITVMIN